MTTDDLADDVQRLAAQSRVRLEAVRVLREQQRLVVEGSRRRLDASRRLLASPGPAATDAPGPVVPVQPGAPVTQG